MLPLVQEAGRAVVGRKLAAARPGAVAGPGPLLEAARAQVHQPRHVRRRRDQHRRERPPGGEHADGALPWRRQVGAAAHQRGDVAIGVRAAPVVVGVVGVGREHQHRLGAAAAPRLHDHEVMGLLAGRVGELDVVVAARPVRPDLDLGAAGQPQPSRSACSGRRMIADRQPVAPQHDLARRPRSARSPACRGRRRAGVQREPLAGRYAQAVGVAGEHGPLYSLARSM